MASCSPAYVVLLAATTFAAARAQTAPYYPPAGAWEHRAPEQQGMDGAKLQEAIAFAKEKEVRAPRDREAPHYQPFAREPFGNAVGPMKTRGDPSGVIVR